MDSLEKRKSVMKNYELIVDQYFEEFGTMLEDVDLINKFECYLPANASILDLGGGTGKLTNYFLEKGYKSICYDFSKNMKNYAKKYYPNISFILDDILNIKIHFGDNSMDGIIAMYSLFHIPKENIKQLFMDIHGVLKEDGLFCFSLQLGDGEDFVDEPYLKEKGKNALYINYLTKKQIYNLLKKCNFEKLYEKEKHEAGNNVIGKDGNDAIYIISRRK